jgi:hypothetical protein
MAAIPDAGWESRAAAWLLCGAWPPVAGLTALLGHLLVSFLPRLDRVRERFLIGFFGAAALIATAPVVLQAEIFHPGGLLRMSALAAGIALAAAALAAALPARAGTPRRWTVLVEAVLLFPVTVWCLRTQTPPPWFGVTLAVLGGHAFHGSLLAPRGARSRVLQVLAAIFLLAVGVSLFRLAG